MAPKCAIASCTLKSSNYVQCSGDCGRSIHTSCAGYSRNVSLASLSIWRNICDDCFPDWSTASKLSILEQELKKQGDTLAQTLAYVKKAVARMDLRDEHIEDIEKSLVLPSDNSVSGVVSVIEAKIDQLLQKFGSSNDNNEKIDLTPLIKKFDALGNKVAQDATIASNAVRTRLDTVEQMIDEIRKGLDKPPITPTEVSCQTDPILSIAQASAVSLSPIVIVGDDSPDVSFDGDDSQDPFPTVLPQSLRDEIEMQSSTSSNWDMVSCLAELATGFNVLPTLPHLVPPLSSLIVVVCDKSVRKLHKTGNRRRQPSQTQSPPQQRQQPDPSPGQSRRGNGKRIYRRQQSRIPPRSAISLPRNETTTRQSKTNPPLNLASNRNRSLADSNQPDFYRPQTKQQLLIPNMTHKGQRHRQSRHQQLTDIIHWQYEQILSQRQQLSQMGSC